MIKNRLTQAVRRIDAALGRVYVEMVGERGVLLILLFHGLFRDRAQIKEELVYPQQGVTVSVLEACLNYFVNHGYRCVSPKELEDLGNERYLMLTFDDGYYNNILALPVLEKYRAPATFFISTNYVKKGQPFWWDVLYRERRKAGRSEREIVNEMKRVKQLTLQKREEYVRQAFDGQALRSISDIDRPLTLQELQVFARHELVHIGNHTLDHAILSNCSKEEAREQIAGAQLALGEMVGYMPSIIAYPNGNYTPTVLEETRRAGLRFGITTENRINPLPLGEEQIRLGRVTLWGDQPLEEQLVSFRHAGKFSIEKKLRALYKRT